MGIPPRHRVDLRMMAMDVSLGLLRSSELKPQDHI